MIHYNMFYDVIILNDDALLCVLWMLSAKESCCISIENMFKTIILVTILRSQAHIIIKTTFTNSWRWSFVKIAIVVFIENNKTNKSIYCERTIFWVYKFEYWNKIFTKKSVYTIYVYLWNVWFYQMWIQMILQLFFSS